MSRPARDNSLSAFRNSTGNVAVILISLKAGGEGLNLQEANHVFVVDPWWNPASEMQVTSPNVIVVLFFFRKGEGRDSRVMVVAVLLLLHCKYCRG